MARYVVNLSNKCCLLQCTLISKTSIYFKSLTEKKWKEKKNSPAILCSTSLAETWGHQYITRGMIIITPDNFYNICRERSFTTGEIHDTVEAAVYFLLLKLSRTPYFSAICLEKLFHFEYIFYVSLFFYPFSDALVKDNIGKVMWF